MKQIKNEQLLNNYLKQYNFETIFDTKNLSFRLYQYDRNEILNNIHDSSCFLQFLVEGNVLIYSIREDNSRYPVCLLQEFTLLGDIEFCGEPALPFFVEATRKVTCIELPLYDCKNDLLCDTAFLRFLSHSIAHKIVLFSQSEAFFTTLEEKLLHYLQFECPGQCLQGVEATAIHLHCSRRQLQRLLKSLTERKIIEKIGKGIYQLKKC